MGYDKYGLDWNVWGGSGGSGGASNNPLLDSIGRGWSGQQTRNVEEQEQTATAAEALTARLRNACFKPDDTTDFNQPCNVSVEIDTKKPVKSTVTMSLWGKYKDQEYNLQHEIKVEPKGTVAEGSLKLFYVEEYYNDVASNATEGQGVEYILKCSMKGASPVESEPLLMPRSKDITLILEDDDSKPYCGAKVTIANGKVYTSDTEGKVLIPARDHDGTNVDVVKIELGQNDGI